MKRYKVVDLELNQNQNPLFETDIKEEADIAYQAIKAFMNTHNISCNICAVCVVDTSIDDICY